MSASTQSMWEECVPGTPPGTPPRSPSPGEVSLTLAPVPPTDEEENSLPDVVGVLANLDRSSTFALSAGRTSERKRLRTSGSSTSSGSGPSPETLRVKMGVTEDQYARFLSEMPEGANLVHLMETHTGLILLALWNMTSGKLRGMWRTVDGLRDSVEGLTSEVNRLKGMTNFTYAFCKSMDESGKHSLPPKSRTGGYR